MKLIYNPDGENTESLEGKAVGNGQNSEPEMTVLAEDNVKKSSKVMREKMKDRPFKEKVAYYVSYYKWQAIGLIVGIAIVVSIVTTIANNKDYSFVAMMVNSVNINADKINEDFERYAMLDTKDHRCYIDPNESESIGGASASEIGTATRFTAMISTADLDVAVFNSDLFFIKAYNDVFIDLREVLSPEDIAEYEDRFFYIDMVKVRKYLDDVTASASDLESIGTQEEQRSRLPLYMDPSTMEEPVPVGIVVEDSPLLQTTRAYYDTIPVFGIITNTQKADTAVTFLHYLYDPSVNAKEFCEIPLF